MKNRGIVWLPLLIIIATVALAGIVGYSVVTEMNSDNDDNTNTTANIVTNRNINSNTNSTTYTNTNSANVNAASNVNTNTSSTAYFQVQEWDVEFPSSDGITYAYSMNAESTIASFSTTAIKEYENCGTSQAPIGTLSRYRATVTEGPLSTSTPVKIGDWYYYYQGSQATCATDARIVELQSTARSELGRTFPSLRAVTTTEVADWKTYTNETYGYSIQYPNDWSVLMGPDSKSVQILPPGTEDDASLERSPGLAIEKVDAIAAGDCVGNPAQDQRTVTINGITATRQSEGCLYAQLGAYITKSDGTILEAHWPEFYIADYPEYEQILSTFQITSETTDWLTYTNEAYGYSIQYPNNWDVTTAVLDPGYVAFYAPDNSAHVLIEPIYGMSNFGFDNFTQTVVNTTLGGKPVKQVVWSQANGDKVNCSYQFEVIPASQWVATTVTDEIPDTASEVVAGNFVGYECNNLEVVPQILSTLDFTQ